MHSHEDGFVFLPFALDECHVLKSGGALAEGYQAEVAVFRGHVGLVAHLYQGFLLESVGYEVFDGDDVHLVFLGKLHEVGHAGHRSVVVHDFHECSCGIESCQFA